MKQLWKAYFRENVSLITAPPSDERGSKGVYHTILLQILLVPDTTALGLQVMGPCSERSSQSQLPPCTSKQGILPYRFRSWWNERRPWCRGRNSLRPWRGSGTAGPAA